MLVESLQPCPVGTEVICEIPLPGGRRRLRGKVARLQALSPAAVGLAIAFTELDTPDQEKLSEAVGQDDGRSRMVQVRFEGMREPMRSRAHLTEDGLRLSTALPFLRLRSPVEVTFLSGPSKVQSKGLVRQVELDQFAADGTPRLAVSVAFSAEPEVQPGTPVGVSAPAESTPTVPALPTMAAAPTHVPDPQPPAPPPAPVVEERGSPVMRMVAMAAVVALLGLGAVTYLRTPGQVADQGAPPPPIVTVPPEPEAVAPPPSAPSPTPVAVAAARESPSLPVVTRPAPPPLVVPPPLPPDTPGPIIESDGIETTAVVPISGSTQGSTHYSLARRRGVVVNLPRGRSELPIGLHSIGHDGLRYVWIRDRAESGIQVRFIFLNPPPDERLLELEDSAVRVRVRLHAPAVAQPDPPAPLDEGAESEVVGPVTVTP